MGYVCFENDASIVEGVSRVFPAFFFLVAALVCATTMTRMVNDHRTRIGTLKALGYGNSSISGLYLLYAGSAALFGAILGYFLGTSLIPTIIWKVYEIMYGRFSALLPVFDGVLLRGFAVGGFAVLGGYGLCVLPHGIEGKSGFAHPSQDPQSREKDFFGTAPASLAEDVLFTQGVCKEYSAV